MAGGDDFEVAEASYRAAVALAGGAHYSAAGRIVHDTGQRLAH